MQYYRAAWSFFLLGPSSSPAGITVLHFISSAQCRYLNFTLRFRILLSSLLHLQTADICPFPDKPILPSPLPPIRAPDSDHPTNETSDHDSTYDDRPALYATGSRSFRLCLLLPSAILSFIPQPFTAHETPRRPHAPQCCSDQNHPGETRYNHHSRSPASKKTNAMNRALIRRAITVPE